MPKKQKQEIKVGVILELNPAEELVLRSMMEASSALLHGMRTMTGMHNDAVKQMFKTIEELFPETKNFHIATDIIKGKAVIHIRSHK